MARTEEYDRAVRSSTDQGNTETGADQTGNASQRRCHGGRSLSAGLPNRVLLWCSALVGHAAAQTNDGSSVLCATNLGVERPGGSFAFRAWLQQGQCIRDVSSYTQCRSRLANLLANGIDTLHQTEYSASASVLTLLPTIGALFGSPTAEIWALLKICPPVGAMALSLSFGGTLLSNHSQDYINAWAKQGVRSFALNTESEKGQDDGDVALIQGKAKDASGSLDYMINTMMQPAGTAQLKFLSSSMLMTIGFVLLFVLLAGVMSGMAIVEQGAVYSTWCTSIWWMHVWYLVVTFTTIFDAWIQLPFQERWKISLSERPDLVGFTTGADEQGQLSDIMGTSGPADFKNTLENIRPMTETPLQKRETTSSTSQTPREVLIIVSVSREDKQLPMWVTISRLLSRAVGLTVYVFATSVFAAVSLLALPMAQMVLILVMAAGLFGRAVTSALVNVMTQRIPIIHIMTDTDDTADRVLKRVLRFRPTGATASSWPITYEVNGAVLLSERCIGHRKRWPRSLLGLFAPGS